MRSGRFHLVNEPAKPLFKIDIPYPSSILPSMPSVPKSASIETNSLIYFARMVDKIRLHAKGDLREDFQANLGKGFDGVMCGFLRVDYAALTERVLQGGTDEELLDWCYANGRELNATDLHIWKEFLRKVGWNDGVSEILERRKRESHLEHRADIQTMLEYFEYDEGRKC